MAELADARDLKTAHAGSSYFTVFLTFVDVKRFTALSFSLGSWEHMGRNLPVTAATALMNVASELGGAAPHDRPCRFAL